MTDSQNQIAFEQIGLGSILRQNKLEVPPNQREYAWEHRQVTQLFQDLSLAISNGDYFLGTIVTIPRSNGTLEVVDGQQRLATTAILLAAIRDYLEERGEKVLVESINTEFLTSIDRAKRSRVPNLKLNIDDNELFTQIVNPGDRTFSAAKPGRVSNDLLIAAYKEARAHVRRSVALVDEKDHGDVLERWVTFLENHALVVLLRVPNESDAYRMFETLNDRGLRTGQVDLIKNYLFKQAGSRLPEVQSRWSYMRGALESMEEEGAAIDFLRHSLIALTGLVREKDVYKVVQDTARAEQGAITFTGTLESLATAYVATFNADHERWTPYPVAARRAIQVLNLLNIKPIRPPILAITAKMSPKEAPAAFEFLISLGVRLVVAASTRSESVESPLSSAARDVFDGTITTAAELKKQLAQITPNDQEFHDAFLTTPVSNAKFARYYLRSLELSVKEEPEPYFVPQDDPQVITLEHVLPRKPEGNWPGLTDDEVRIYSRRLGNLVLMRASDNSGLGSAPFKDKKRAYASSPYYLTSMVGELEDWTVTAIQDRQKALAKIAVNTWPI